MAQPLIIPRDEHSLSRKNIDADALKVLRRLSKFDHIAYLVGGSVRDLLLGRNPKDFDVGTSAHPHQIKQLFRNCWIIGRRFRLAHVKFGQKTIEVATFRRLVTPGSERDPDTEPVSAGTSTQAKQDQLRNRIIRRDNTFGTPEEDAFRRDFTVNALFYDIATSGLIDYVGGLKDLDSRLIRCIGDPNVRFLEDPVRMVRAVAFAARLDFRIDKLVLDAITKHRGEIRHSAPARMLEELYKILRNGSAERTFRSLARVNLLKYISPELHKHQNDHLWQSLRALDTYRARFQAAPDTLTNSILLGSLIVPSGLLPRRARPSDTVAPLTLGALPIARGQVDKVQQIISVQARLLDPELPQHLQRALLNRKILPEALGWMEIQNHTPDALKHWRALMASNRTQTSPKGVRRRRPRRHQRRGRGKTRPST